MMRLDRFLTSQHIGSRSEVKQLCKKGLVEVDGLICKDAEYKIDPQKNSVTVLGKAVRFQKNHYYMLHKPAGYISAAKDSKEETVLSFFSEKERQTLFPVGRLDKDSEGLLLITDNGAFAHRLTSPESHVPKTYEVMINGIPNEAALLNLRNGTDIGDETLCRPAQVELLKIFPDYCLNKIEKKKLPKDTPDVITAARIRITVTEGRFHQIKRMFHANRYEVFSLKRTAIGQLMLDEKLKPGEYRPLTEEELEKTEWKTNLI